MGQYIYLGDFTVLQLWLSNLSFLFNNTLYSPAIDSFEPKNMVTRKLRRRHYDPLPTVEKRRKVAPLSSLVYVLEENEAEEDVKMIFKVSTGIEN